MEIFEIQTTSLYQITLNISDPNNLNKWHYWD